MNNIKIWLRRFLSNKNTVTLILCLLAVVLIYFLYEYNIDQAVNPKAIPYAIEDIQPRTKIRADMIGMVEVAPDFIGKGDIILNSSNIVGMYTNVNAFIPKGSFFYEGQVISVDDLPNAGLLDIPEGEVAYNLKVDVESSYGNSLLPGNTIDIYFKAFDENGKVMVGKLLSNVVILAVKDSNGNNVFDTTEETRTPALYILSVTPEVQVLLRQVEYLTESEAELIPVPTSTSYDQDPEDTVLSSDQVQAFIEARSGVFSENEDTGEVEDVTEEETTNE